MYPQGPKKKTTLYIINNPYNKILLKYITGLILPSHFIASAEENGLIVPIGKNNATSKPFWTANFQIRWWIWNDKGGDIS